LKVDPYATDLAGHDLCKPPTGREICG